MVGDFVLGKTINWYIVASPVPPHMQYPIKTKQIMINFEINNKPAVFIYSLIARGLLKHFP